MLQVKSAKPGGDEAVNHADSGGKGKVGAGAQPGAEQAEEQEVTSGR